MTVDLALTEVAQGIFELRLPIPFEDGMVNVFLFADGDEADLLDCGMNAEESLQAIEQALRHIGARRLRRLLVTHIHPDHYGAAGALAGDGRADLYMHRLEVPLVHPRYVELEHLVEQVRAYLLVNGVPEDEAEVLSNSQRALSQVVKPADPTVQLDGAERIRMGAHTLRVEWTPGHSPGHICLVDEDDGLLFAGDHILPDLSPNIGLHPQSTPNPLDDYLAGLERMARLRPALVLPAHGRPFAGVQGRVEALVSHHRRRLAQIEELVGAERRARAGRTSDRRARAGRTSDELSGWDVALELWGPRENLYEKRLALQEGLAHLQALAVQGRIAKLVRPGSVRWRKI